MKDNAKTTKISYIVSLFSIVISMVGMGFSIMHLRYSYVSNNGTGFALTSFFSMLTIFLANMIQFILIRKKYKHKN